MDYIPFLTDRRSYLQADLEWMLALANQHGVAEVNLADARRLISTLKGSRSFPGPSSGRTRSKALTSQPKAKNAARVAMKASHNDRRRRISERALVLRHEEEETSHPEDGSDGEDVPLAQQYANNGALFVYPLHHLQRLITAHSPDHTHTHTCPHVWDEEQEPEVSHTQHQGGCEVLSLSHRCLPCLRTNLESVSSGRLPRIQG